MDSLNSFSGGMNKDLAVDKVPANQYYDALNMRIVTDTGGTSSNAQNVKGNLYKFRYPVVPAIWSVTADTGFNADETSDITVDINGQVVVFPGLAESFDTIANAINNDTTYQAMGVRAYTNQNSIYDDIPILYITLLAGNLSSFNITATGATFIVSQYSTNQLGLKTIGWVSLREDIILFTTNSSSSTPINTMGQIWKFSYDKQTLNHTLVLLYNNFLNTSIVFPIANPGMVEARYETPNLQRVYWTDNFNTMRTINVADPNLYGTDPRLLGLTPPAYLSHPIPQFIEQSSGKLKTGIVQTAFRLSKNNGNSTPFSSASYPIFIVEDNEETDLYTEYSGGEPGVIPSEIETSKAISYKIDRLDTNYNRIEIVSIYRKDLTSTPEINLIINEPIPANGTFIYKYTGSESVIPITVEEYNQTNQIFSRVGTIATKNNYLFTANVKTSKLDLDWDARAYRFKDNSGTTQVEDINGIVTNVNSTNWTLDEEHDAINPNDSPIPNASGNYLYKADGTTLGGEGLNISYEFIEQEVLSDEVQLASAALVPYKGIVRNSQTFLINSQSPLAEEYNHVNTFPDYHSPYLSGFLKGYMRDEVYRFAIVFYDLYGNLSFAKWIGDIRIPHMWMPNIGATDPEDRYLFSETMVEDAANPNIKYTKPIGINFTINNLDQLSKEISGYQIVRCERKPEDRTVLGQGILTPAYYDPFAGLHLLLPNDTIYQAENTESANQDFSNQIASFQSPEFLFPNQFGYTYKAGDQIDILGVLGEDEAANIKDSTGADMGSGFKVYKNYFQMSSGTVPNPILDPGGNLTPYNLDAGRIVDNWKDSPNEISLDSIPRIVNHSAINSSWTANGGSHGGKTLLLKGDFTAFGTDKYQAAGNDALVGTGRIYLANYKRPLSNQYGGKSYSNRSKAEYISTNHFQPILSNSISYTSKIYGGDIYVVIFDNVKQFADQEFSSDFHVTRLFPTETTVNVCMRQATHIPGRIPNLNAPNPTPNTVMFEDFLINNIFSFENDLRKFFPKPLGNTDETEFDCRIYNSAFPKINGELSDAWGTFKPEDYIEVDSQFGPINSVINFQDRLYYFQDKATGIYQVNERALIQDVNGSDLTLGTGGLKQRFDYISDKIGCKHKFSISKSPKSLLFFDVNRRRLYTITQGLKELQGINGFLQSNVRGDILTNDNPFLYKGIASTYDYRFDEFLITFLDNFTNDAGDSEINRFTVSYNDVYTAEGKDFFGSRYSFTPSVYINDQYSLFMPYYDDVLSTESMYINHLGNYGNFFGVIYPSSITFISNENSPIEKIFDNFVLNGKTYLNGIDVPNQFFDTFQVYNDYQDTGKRDFSTKARFIKRKWNASVGGDQNNTRFTERIKSNYIFTTLETLNQNNYNIILESVISKFRINPTML